MSVFLGIDTSNYTTSVAVAAAGKILQNEKIPVPVAAGERGVRQSDAVFAHVKNLPSVAERIGRQEILAVGYSARPRDAEGSYMPCFLAGQALAESQAALFGLPAYAFSHQAGHLEAAVYSSGGREALGNRFAAFHVSGGTTELLLVTREKKRPCPYRVEILGGSEDLTAGQAIDRVGVRLGLPFPAGAGLEALAAALPFPRTRPSVKGLSCHFSGLENQAAAMLEEGKAAEEIAAYVLAYVQESLRRLALGVRERYPDIPLLFAGGVMSCRRFREYFRREFGAWLAEPAFSADNAAGIALLCEEKYYDDHSG